MRRALLPIAVAILLFGAGCSGSSDPGPSGSPSASSTSVLPSSSPTTSSPEDEAAVAAEEVLREYYRTIPRCMADPPKTKPTCFDQVAITSELNDRRNALISAQERGTHSFGEIVPVSIELKSVDLTNKVDETPPTVPNVVFRVCVDVSGYNIVDAEGKSVVPADRKPRVVVDVTVLNYKLPDPAQWRVGYQVPAKGESC